MSNESFCCAPSQKLNFEEFSRQHYLTTLDYMKGLKPEDDAFEYCMEVIDLYAKHNGRGCF